MYINCTPLEGFQPGVPVSHLVDTDIKYFMPKNLFRSQVSSGSVLANYFLKVEKLTL